MTLKSAIERCSLLKGKFLAGLEALERNHKRLIRARQPRTIIGSINIDAAMKESEPEAPRWDYLVGKKDHKERNHFIEVHPAETSEVQTVLTKLCWLHGFIKREIPEVCGKKFENKYSWVGTRGVHIIRTSREFRLIAQNGLHIAAHLEI